MAVPPNIVLDKCSQAGISFWLASRVALELKDRITERLTDEELNRLILDALRLQDTDAAQVFENYHNIRVRTSKNTLESFDRRRIAASLVKETKLPKIVADSVAKEVEDDIRRLQLKSISAPLVREMVGTKLLEKKLLDARTAYTRVGLPVYDITEMIERERSNPVMLNRHFGNAVSAEYTLTKVLSHDISSAYLGGDIYIHGIENFITTPYSFQNDLRWFLKHGLVLDGSGDYLSVAGPAKKAAVVASHAARVLAVSKDYVSGGVSFDSFNCLLAPYVHGMSEKEVFQTIQTFLYELNQEYYTDRLLYSINLETEVPGYLQELPAVGPGGKEKGTYADYVDEMHAITAAVSSNMLAGDYRGKRFNWPYVCVKTSDGLPVPSYRPVSLVRDKGSNLAFVYGNVVESSSRAGYMQAVSLNAPKIAHLSKDEDDFFSLLNSVLTVVRDTMVAKQGIMERRMRVNKILPFFTQKFEGQEYATLERFSYLISPTGLPEACERVAETDAAKFGEHVLRFAKKKLSEFAVETGLRFALGYVRDSAALKRFSSINQRFGQKEDYSDSLAKDASSEVLLQQYCNGGDFLVSGADAPDAKYVTLLESRAQ